MLHNRFKSCKLFFFVLSLVNVVVKLTVGINFFTYIIYVYIFMLAGFKMIDWDEFLLYSLFIPNKYLQILSMPIYVFTSYGWMKTYFNKKIIAFFSFMILSGLINCFIYNGVVVAMIIQGGFYYCTVILARKLQRGLEINKAINNFDDFFKLEICAIALDIIITRGWGDNLRGTFESAHYLGLFMLAYIFLLLKKKNKKKVGAILRILLALIVTVLCDAKHVFLVVLFSVLMGWIFNKVKLRKQVLTVGVMLLMGVLVFIKVVQTPIGQYCLEKSNMGVYVYNDSYNKKYAFINRTCEKMKSLNGLIGFGVGQYGSQISITLSKGIIYDWNAELSSYKYATEPFADSIEGLMDERYTNYGIRISSMVMGYPLVSFVSMIAELGIIGFLLFLSILDDIFESNDNEFIISFLFLTIFDTYLEITCVFVLILYITSICRKRKNDLVEEE